MLLRDSCGPSRPTRRCGCCCSKRSSSRWRRLSSPWCCGPVASAGRWRRWSRWCCSWLPAALCWNEPPAWSDCLQLESSGWSRQPSPLAPRWICSSAPRKAPIFSYSSGAIAADCRCWWAAHPYRPLTMCPSRPTCPAWWPARCRRAGPRQPCALRRWPPAPMPCASASQLPLLT